MIIAVYEGEKSILEDNCLSSHVRNHNFKAHCIESTPKQCQQKNVADVVAQQLFHGHIFVFVQHQCARCHNKHRNADAGYTVHDISPHKLRRAPLVGAHKYSAYMDHHHRQNSNDFGNVQSNISFTAHPDPFPSAHAFSWHQHSITP